MIHRHLGLQPYQPVWDAMRAFTNDRTDDDDDELWTLEHPPTYTRGQRDHNTAPLNDAIPVIDVDRGGLITYHGPGQLIVYVLIDLRRAGLGIRSMVNLLEQSVIDLALSQDAVATRRSGAPGVYVDGRKLASLGLRVRNARTLHGLALNVDMDLQPFEWIETCGLEGIEMTQLRDLGSTLDIPQAANALVGLIAKAMDVPVEPAASTLPVCD